MLPETPCIRELSIVTISKKSNRISKYKYILSWTEKFLGQPPLKGAMSYLIHTYFGMVIVGWSTEWSKNTSLWNN